MYEFHAATPSCPPGASEDDVERIALSTRRPEARGCQARSIRRTNVSEARSSTRSSRTVPSHRFHWWTVAGTNLVNLAAGPFGDGKRNERPESAKPRRSARSSIGVMAAMAVTRLMTSLLFEVSPLDSVTYVAVAVLLVIGQLGRQLCARAARVRREQPVEALAAD